MSDPSQTLNRKNSQNTLNATSSPASQDGHLPSNSQESRQIGLFGQEAAPASPSQRREEEKAAAMIETCGIHGSNLYEFASRQSFLANKLRALLDSGGSTEYSMTWRRKVTPHGRVYYQLAASGKKDFMRRTSDQGYGGRREGWPTPVVGMIQQDHYSKESIQKAADRKQQIHLSGLVKILDLDQTQLSGWPTPNCDDPNNATRESGEYQSLTRTAQTAGWPTPQTMDSLPPMEYEKRLNHPSRPGRTVSGNLREVVTQTAGWATPNVNTSKNNGAESQKGRHGPALDVQVGLIPNGSTAQTESTGESLVLNPRFVAFLMGVPQEWIDVAPTNLSRRGN